MYLTQDETLELRLKAKKKDLAGSAGLVIVKLNMTDMLSSIFVSEER